MIVRGIAPRAGGAPGLSSLISHNTIFGYFWVLSSILGYHLVHHTISLKGSVHTKLDLNTTTTPDTLLD